MATTDTTRRALLGAIAAVPAVAIAAPALARLPAERSGWEEAVADYRRITAELNAHPYGHSLPGDPDHDRLHDEERELIARQVAAERHLFSIPAPDAAAILEKAEIYESAAMFDGVDIGGEHFAGLVRDVRRLLMGEA